MMREDEAVGLEDPVRQQGQLHAKTQGIGYKDVAYLCRDLAQAWNRHDHLHLPLMVVQLMLKSDRSIPERWDVFAVGDRSSPLK